MDRTAHGGLLQVYNHTGRGISVEVFDSNYYFSVGALGRKLGLLNCLFIYKSGGRAGFMTLQ